jgi:hypothetical protein
VDADALCIDECKAGDAWSAAAGECVKCLTALTCTAEGETGLLLATTGADTASCICETVAGYYPGSEGSVAEKCDGDGDGWVCEKAQPSVESSNEVIRGNARCSVRYVSGFRLVNEEGADFFTASLDDLLEAFPGEASLGIPPGLPLYESSSNDGATGERPVYGDGVSGRELRPEEVSSLTKACLSELGDTNDNGVTDVEETRGSKLSRTFATKELKSYFEKYTEYGYYLELFDGWFDKDTSEYVIAERTRQGFGVPVRYPDGAADYVRSCTRYPDQLYTWSGTTLTAPSSVGSDFIRFGEAPGIGHPSQFKCVHIVSPGNYSGATERTDPELMMVEDGTGLLVRQGTGGTAKYAWATNSCHATAQSAQTDPNNPSYPVITCTADVEPPSTGSVRWAAVAYEEYPTSDPYVNLADPGGYERGCANECTLGFFAADCYHCVAGTFGEGQLALDEAGTPCGTTGLVCDGQGNCGTCVPHDHRCKDSQTQQECAEDGTWRDQLSCPFGCRVATGLCYPDCAPSMHSCQTNTPRTCDDTGHWANDDPCGSGTECVGAGVCLRSAGQICSTAADCASATCTTFRADSDGDGFGAATASRLCGATPPVGYVVDATDCCDADANANPEQTGYFTEPRNVCGGYDYDCSGSDELWFDVLCSGYEYLCWAYSVPGCGTEGGLVDVFESACWFVGCPETQSCH